MTAESTDEQQPISMAVISYAAYQLNLRQKPDCYGVVTLCKIDYALEKSRLHDAEDEYQELDQQAILDKLPKEYHNLVQAFSKRDANVIPPHRSCDYRINLQSSPEQKRAPFYKINGQELYVVRDYITKNL